MRIRTETYKKLNAFHLRSLIIKQGDIDTFFTVQK